MDTAVFSRAMKAFFAPLRLIAAALLFWALAKHSHNYYVILRWLVFLVALWGAYRSYQEDSDKWFLVGFHVVLMVLFNPFLSVSFAKSTWNFINVVTGLVIFFSTFVLDENFLDTIIGRWVAIGLGISLYGAVFLLGLALIYTATDGTLQNLRLWFGSSLAKAQITRVTHDVEEVETETSAGYRDVYNVDYSFDSNGKTFYGASSLDENPAKEDSVPTQPTFLDVEYQSTNPNNNRALASSNKLYEIFGALIILALGLAAAIWSLNRFKSMFMSMKAKAQKTA